MGSPETCPTCGSDDVLDRRMAPWALDLSDEMNPKTITKLCRNAWHDTPTPPAPADDAPGEVVVYRPAAWRGQDPYDGHVGRDDVKWVCRRADDAGGAEALDDEAASIEQRVLALDKVRPGYAARLARGILGKRDAGGAEASDRAGEVRIVTAVLRKQYGHVVKYSHDLVAYEIVATLLPLPARDDAVEEARDAERFRWLMSRNFGFAFDAEKCGISTGRWGKWPEEADAQRAMIDRAIAHYAALRRAKGGDK